MIKWFKRKKKQEPEIEQPEQIQKEAQEEELSWEDEPALPENEIAPLEEPEQVVDEPEVPAEAVEMEGEEAESEFAPEETSAMEDEAGEEFDEDEGEEDEEVPEKGVRKVGFFKRLRARLHKTREKFTNRIDRLVLGKKVIDQDLLDELEEILITSDLGVKTTQMLLRKVADKVRRKELSDPGKLREQIRDEIRAVLEVEAPPLDYRGDHPFIVMIIGVNGVGKTTTVGKLAKQLKQQNLRTMLVAGDTFRAAAVEQLSIWGERVGVPVVKQKMGSDPSAVAYDAIEAALSRDVDVVLLDTAGRMHTPRLISWRS